MTNQKMNLASLLAPVKPASVLKKGKQDLFVSLPVELIHEVLSYLNLYDQKQYRLVNRLLNAIISTRIFESISLHTTSQSAKRFDALARSSTVGPYVQRIDLRATVDARARRLRSSDISHRNEVDFTDALSSIIHLQSLRRLSLSFQEADLIDRNHKNIRKRHDNANPDIMASMLMWKIIHHLDSVLQSCSEKYVDYHLDALTLIGLPQDNDARWTSTGIFTKLLARIKTLSLRFVENSRSTKVIGQTVIRSLEQPSNWEFWKSLYTYWLEPSAQQLTSLSLQCSEEWGWLHVVEFDRFQFPCLRYLLLEQYTFATDFQVQWITRLAPTLEELYLNQCSILLQAQTRDILDPQTGQISDMSTADLLLQRIEAETNPVTTSFSLCWATLYEEWATRFHRLRRFKSGSWCVQPGLDGKNQAGDSQVENLHPRHSLHRYILWHYLENQEVELFSRCASLTPALQARIKADDDAFDVLRRKMEWRGQPEGIFHYAPVWRFCHHSCDICPKFRGPYSALSEG